MVGPPDGCWSCCGWASACATAASGRRRCCCRCCCCRHLCRHCCRGSRGRHACSGGAAVTVQARRSYAARRAHALVRIRRLPLVLFRIRLSSSIVVIRIACIVAEALVHLRSATLIAVERERTGLATVGSNTQRSEERVGGRLTHTQSARVWWLAHPHAPSALVVLFMPLPLPVQPTACGCCWTRVAWSVCPCAVGHRRDGRDDSRRQPACDEHRPSKAQTAM